MRILLGVSIYISQIRRQWSRRRIDYCDIQFRHVKNRAVRVWTARLNGLGHHTYVTTAAANLLRPGCTIAMLSD